MGDGHAILCSYDRGGDVRDARQNDGGLKSAATESTANGRRGEPRPEPKRRPFASLRTSKPPHSLNCRDDPADTGTACRAPTVPSFTVRTLLVRRRCDWWDVFLEVAEEQRVEMQGGAGAFVYGVGAVGVFHEVYWFV